METSAAVVVWGVVFVTWLPATFLFQAWGHPIFLFMLTLTFVMAGVSLWISEIVRLRERGGVD